MARTGRYSKTYLERFCNYVVAVLFYEQAPRQMSVILRRFHDLGVPALYHVRATKGSGFVTDDTRIIGSESSPKEYSLADEFNNKGYVISLPLNDTVRKKIHGMKFIELSDKVQ